MQEELQFEGYQDGGYQEEASSSKQILLRTAIFPTITVFEVINNNYTRRYYYHHERSGNFSSTTGLSDPKNISATNSVSTSRHSPLLTTGSVQGRQVYGDEVISLTVAQRNGITSQSTGHITDCRYICRSYQ